MIFSINFSSGASLLSSNSIEMFSQSKTSPGRDLSRMNLESLAHTRPLTFGLCCLFRTSDIRLTYIRVHSSTSKSSARPLTSYSHHSFESQSSYQAMSGSATTASLSLPSAIILSSNSLRPARSLPQNSGGYIVKSFCLSFVIHSKMV